MRLPLLRHALASILSVSLVVSTAPSSWAQPKTPAKSLREELPKEAQERFDVAVQLYGAGAGKTAAARAEFLRAYEISKNPRLLFNVAVCEKDVGRFHKAIEYLDHELAEGRDTLSKDEVDRARTFADGLRPFVGTLVFEINEPGASIFVDGEDIGQSPLPPIPMAGQREISAFKPGFDSAPIKVNVAGGTRVVAKLHLEAREKTADVEITASGAPNATIYIDNIERGPSPYRGTVRVQTEPHTFEARAPGFASASQSAVAADGSHVLMTLALSAETRLGRLSILTQPEGGMIALDGIPMGVTRWAGPVEAGTHQVTVRKDGYYTRILDLDVTRGQKRAVTAQLDEKQNISWVVWGLGALAVVGGGITAAVILSQPRDVQIPGSLRVADGKPVPASFQF